MELFHPIFSALESAGARYLVVGGMATALHGIPRMTADLDIAINLASENVDRTIDALLGLGMASRAPVDPHLLGDPATRDAWSNEKHMTVLTMQSKTTPVEVDIFVTLPFDFDSAWNERVEMQVGGVTVPVVARRTLIAMKEATGRAIDRQDAELLRQLDD